ncbi:hypothetical protein [Buttiauxella sp. A111]|uniref:hypothetical protein n=1 Tax=Buttiauxella sp. A111 TaxID=2563088 RepID=UPI0010D33438|nr:hypothetical protein [Buttiauxella sp. A111]GDX05721.1 hypothetical protein BSPA111_19220 [Buttiauxella sp. A111]
MWREAKVAFSDSLAALNCSIVPAHPWIYGLGQQTDNGAYLSPVNAVSYLSGKLASVGGNADVVVFLVTGLTHNSFMASLNALTAVFPAPVFTQVSRLVKSAAELATIRMQLPAKSTGGLPAAIPLSVPTSRAALNAMAMADAQKAVSTGSSLASMKGQLTEFISQHAALVSDAASGLADLQTKSARAWVFTASGDVATTVKQLLNGIPQQSAVFSVGMMLVGDNLDGVKGMIHEFDPDTGT